MDTFTLRLPHRKSHQLKIRKSTLAKILITIEIVGIILMGWYLRDPLYKKYLAVKPKAYSVQAMDHDKRYLITQNDFLTGKAPPGTKMKLIFNPGRYKRTVRVSPKGNWVVQIPKGLEFKPYRLTLANFDQNNSLTHVESFKTRIQSESIFLQSNLYKQVIRPILPRDLRAQSSLNSASEFRSWLEEMQKLGIYPYCEINTEPARDCPEDSLIMLTDHQGHLNICSNTACFESETAAREIQPIVPPVIRDAISNGHSIPYIFSIASIIDSLVTPPSKIIVPGETAADNIVSELNEEESSLLKTQDNQLQDLNLYIDLSNEPSGE